MKTYRNSGTYRSADFYRGVAPTAAYTLNIPLRKNVSMKSAAKSPGARTAISIKSFNT